MTTELKTLKDFEFEICDSKGNKILRSLSDVRQEAIKWIKHLLADGIGSCCPVAVVGWIKHFFSISEEDLK